MASRQTNNYQQIQKVAVTVPVFAGFAMVMGQNQEASPLCLLVNVIANCVAGLLQTLVLEAWETVSGYVLASHGSPFCPVQLLVGGWHLLRLLAGAA